MNLAEGTLRIFACICGFIAATGCLYLLLSAFLVLRFRRSEDAPEETAAVPVTVLVPLCGDEPGLAARLTGLRGQTYPAPVQIVCGVRDKADPAVNHVRRAAAQEGQWPIDLRSDRRLHGRNRKISNLINMMKIARHDVLVMIDSDMKVAEDHLLRVAGRLQEPDVGAVTCLYQGFGPAGLPSRLAAMGINLHFLPNVVVGLATGMARPCFGATIAIKRDDLAAIGGLRSFSDQLWDDYAIGQAVRAQRKKVVVCDFAPPHVCIERSMRELFANQLRAARTIRGIDPAGHAGAVLTHPFPLALMAALVWSVWWNWALVVAALACRMAVARSVEHRFGAQRAPLLLIPVRDLLSFAVYLASYFSAAVEWRGEAYDVDAEGHLTQTSN